MVGRLATLTTVVADSTVLSLTYTTDRVGNRRTVQATTPSGTRVITYAYDGLQRLTGTVEQPGNTHGFRYDGAGNLLRQQVNGITTTVQTYNNAQEVVAWHYDAAGNRTGQRPGCAGQPLRRAQSTGE
ncbi:MAG: hypothetical protein HC876_20885, partial [Chloroflexaceae bacterium]|nr:hypothetical protein [Chloroflexaceae bacterium]